MPDFINATNIAPPRVPLIDQRTGLISREWYRFFLSIFRLTGGGSNFTSLTDLQLGPPPIQLESISFDPNTPSNAPSDSSLVSQTAEMQKEIEGLQEMPPPGVQELTAFVQQQFNALGMTPQPPLGTMAQLQQANVPWLTFDTSPEGVPPDVGTMAWDGGTTMGLQATANVLIRIGESEFVYVKASSAITKGQLCYHSGVVGSSGVITAAPSPINLADPNQIVGVAAEDIALNGFGLIQISGVLRGFNTTGSSVGETWADGDPLYYNPAYVGSFTKTKPSAPNQKTFMGEVINAGPGGSGSMSIRIVPGSILGGTDSNVQFTSLANNDLIQYDSTLQYWKNVPASTLPVGTATNIANGAAGSVPYQSAPSTTTFLPIGAALQVLKVNAGATAPQWVSGAALTKTDDTNVTLTLGGTPATSLLAATSLTLGWTGQLATSRGGTGLSSFTANGILYASSGSALATSSSFTWNTNIFSATGSNGGYSLQFDVTTTPAALKSIDNTGSSYLPIAFKLGNGSGFIEPARLTSTGLGIFNTSPTYPLDVVGSIRSVAAATQDAVILAGRAGGTSSYAVTLTPTTLSASRTLTLPDNSGTVLTTGATVTVAQGGTGVTTTPSNGQLLIGNGTGYTVANLTAGTGVSISNSAGGISISATGTGGTVTSVSVVSANGFAGSVATATTTPAITISTSITGLLYGNGTAIAAATVSSPLSYSAGTLSIPVATSSANGYLSSTDWSTFNNKQSVSAPVTQTANFSVGATDLWIINNKSGSSCTATLPAASSYSGRVLHFQNYQAQALVSASSNVVQITGGAATTSILLASAGDQCTLVSDGTNWIMTQYTPNNILLLE